MSTVRELPAPAAESGGRWPAIAVLALSTFLVVTSEMLPVGVLTPMSEGLGVTPGTAGFSLAVTGVVAALAAPFVSRLIGGADRRHVLVAAALVLAAGNLITAVAQGFAVLALGRVVVGFAMATVWALAAALATRLVDASRAGPAVSTVVSGVAVASVLGVPFGTFLGDIAGWRSAFGSLALAALLLAAALAALLPALPPQQDAGADGHSGSLLAVPAVRRGLIAVTLLVTAHFAAYTYVRPALEELSGIHGAGVSLLLLLYGLCGIAANFAAGAAAMRRVRFTVLVLAIGITAALLALPLVGTSPISAAVVLVLWGFSYGGVSVCSQIWAVQAAPERREAVTGLFVGAFTGSIALGSFLGGVILDGVGLSVLLWVSAGVAAAAALATAPGGGVDRSAVRRPEQLPADRPDRPGGYREQGF
ncbi:MFS transporter [Nocardia grenadensis]|uniref:MFS transporter n=1 Tax=Nocardia grenadensis TaxID=931537 RepID=UPI0009FF6EBA|nr:MFS transporter [Nocardia grenadensis]